jgi:hypothetical protein
MRKASVVVLAVGLVLAACSASESFEGIENLPPTMGGLPADAPTRPKTPYQYPAVHDMPAPRSEKTLNDEQLLKLEKDLTAARDRQEKAAGATPEPSGKPGAKDKAKASAQPKKRAADKAGTADKP